MTSEEKIVRFGVLISPDTADTELSLYLLEQAEGIIMNRRYPFGAPEGAEFPSRYDHIQLQIAVELYSKMGAEGQVGHKENGIDRTFEAADVSPSLLSRIVPLVGGMS
jgi:hypothetical protein